MKPSASLKAVRWAIASCYESEPVLNLLLVPKVIRHSPLKAALGHPCVQVLLTMPADSCAFSVPCFLHDFCLVDNALPRPEVQVLLVANAQGMKCFCPKHAVMRATVWPALPASCCKLASPQHVLDPLPAPPRIQRYAMAVHPLGLQGPPSESAGLALKALSEAAMCCPLSGWTLTISATQMRVR